MGATNDSCDRSHARKLLQTLSRASVPCALATCRPSCEVTEALEAENMAHLFEVIITAEDIKRGPPDVEPLLYASEVGPRWAGWLTCL